MTLVQATAATLVHFFWQGWIVAALYAVARNWPGRTRSAHFRYLLGCAAMGAMAIAPIATFIILTSPSSTRTTIGVIGSLASSRIATNTHWFATAAADSNRIWLHGVPTWIVFAWLAGSLGFYARFLGGWAVAMRLRSIQVRPAPSEWQLHLDRIRTRLRISRPVCLVVSGAVQVPTVVGYLRPLVLVPVGALTGLSPDLLESLLIHELAHIRRNDYLVGILQSLVEAALFYHPAVWWVSGHLREERELCCDDVAAAACGDPVTYARALAELESYRPAHLRPALGANGASLSRRVARLLNQEPPPVFTTRGSGLIIAGLLLAAGVTLAQRSLAQPAVVAVSSLPSFEVASIKPSAPDSLLKIDFARGGRLVVSHATLRFLIKIAYDVSDDQIVGGPAWFSSKRFDVQARPDKQIPGDPEQMSKDQILLFHQPTRLRLQRLLAERFHLELRMESKPVPVFALVVAKNGLKMKPSASTGDPNIQGNAGRGAIRATRVDMNTLAHFLSEGQTGRPVVDMTGLSGAFDFQLDWTPDSGLNPPADPNQPLSDDLGGISIFTALQQQLGLKLESRAGAAETLVVTHVELPSGN